MRMLPTYRRSYDLNRMGLPLTDAERKTDAPILAHLFWLRKVNPSHKERSICRDLLDCLFQVTLVGGHVNAGGIQIGVTE